MEKKKSIQIIMVLSAVILFSLVYFFIFSEKNYDTGNSKKEENIGNRGSQNAKVVYPVREECSYVNGAEAINLAIERDDVGICDCLKYDEESMNLCGAVVKDSIVFKKAAAENKVGICDEIGDNRRKDKCKETVLEKINYTNSNK